MEASVSAIRQRRKTKRQNAAAKLSPPTHLILSFPFRNSPFVY